MEIVRIKKNSIFFSAKVITNRMAENRFSLIKAFKKGEEKWKQS